jgi:hypothetical protein
MHQPIRAHDLTAKRLTYRLVPETDPQNRDALRETRDCRQTDACFVGRARSGRDQDAVWRAGSDRRDIASVIQNDVTTGAQHLEVLHEVVSKGIIVVDNHDPCHRARTMVAKDRRVKR